MPGSLPGGGIFLSDYLKICFNILTLALCSQRLTCRISASIVLDACLIDFPYKSISSTVNRSSLDRRLLFKTASNSLAFKLLTVSLYRFISGVIFISYAHRHHDGVLCALYMPLLPPMWLDSTICEPWSAVKVSSSTGTTKYI